MSNGIDWHVEQLSREIDKERAESFTRDGLAEFLFKNNYYNQNSYEIADLILSKYKLVARS